MANQRASNSRLLAIGVAVLVVGVLLVYLIIRSADDSEAQPAPTATPTAQPSDAATPPTAEELSSARLPLPLEVPAGMEAVALRANFMRSVAGIPAPGDEVNLYRLPPASKDGQGATDLSSPATSLPPAGPNAISVLDGVEVLAVTGPLPAANDGTLTFIVAVPPSSVPGLLPLANDAELWFTLPASTTSSSSSSSSTGGGA